MEGEDVGMMPDGGGSPYFSPMQQYGSNIVAMTNPEDVLEKMEFTFRNIHVNKSGVEKECGKALMNDAGISSVVGSVQSFVNQVAIMSNLNKNEIPMLMDFLGDTLAKDLMLNRVLYEISDESARDKIYFTALSTAFITLKRAYEEGDKRFWKGTVQEIRSTVDSNGGRGGGFLSGLNPFRKM